MEQWQGRVAVVTGASSGIGAYLAEVLVRSGLKVVGLARRLNLLQEATQRAAKYRPGSFHPIKCDLRNEEEILAAFQQVEESLGPVHILVNNAGSIANERIIDGNTDTFRQILDVNVLAVAICTREASKSMRQHKVNGHIINVNSMAGHDTSTINVPISLYAASKFAITGMTNTIRSELQSLNTRIKVTSISPGAVRTDMIRAVGVPDEVMERMSILEPKDVADAIIYALSTPPHVQVNELIITAVSPPNADVAIH